MGTHPIFESDFDCLTEEMDYDDELRESCDKTGDLLHCRTNCAATNDKEGEMDEFAAEMESELDELLMTAQAQWTKGDKNATSPKPAQADQPTTSKSANELYEKDYFDSSDEEEDSSDRRKKLTNDELLYDPEADEDDAKWMAEHSSKKSRRLGRGAKLSGVSHRHLRRLSTSRKISHSVSCHVLHELQRGQRQHSQIQTKEREKTRSQAAEKTAAVKVKVEKSRTRLRCDRRRRRRSLPPSKVRSLRDRSGRV